MIRNILYDLIDDKFSRPDKDEKLQQKRKKESLIRLRKKEYRARPKKIYKIDSNDKIDKKKRKRKEFASTERLEDHKMKLTNFWKRTGFSGISKSE